MEVCTGTTVVGGTGLADAAGADGGLIGLADGNVTPGSVAAGATEAFGADEHAATRQQTTSNDARERMYDLA